jgi:GT2 family glycosyltransferase
MPGSLISVVILNWNGLDCIIDCVESVEKTAYKNIEIIVVDNASTDNSPHIIKKQFPRVRLLKLDENMGYAAGNNRGFHDARGAFIATLNNDVIVEPDWLDQPLEFLEQDETVGIIACRQMKYDDRETIDCLYGYPLRSLLFQPMGSGKKYSSHHLYAQPGYVLGAGGASAIYRKKLLDELGGFDERYFSYHEESDLCMRAFLTGWKCMYAPCAVVYHRGSFSYGKIKKQMAFYHERNRIWFMYKFYPSLHILKNALWILFLELRLFRVFVVKRRVGGTFFSAIYHGVKGMKSFKDSRKLFMPLLKKKMRIFEQFQKQKKIPCMNRAKTIA